MSRPIHRSFLVLAALAAAGTGVAMTQTTPDLRAQETSSDHEFRRSLRRTPVVRAVERAAPSVVSIGTKRIVKQRFLSWDFLEYERRRVLPGALGSGVIVNESGYVITNLHVINEAAQIFVKLTGLGQAEREIPAQLIATDPDHDLALLRLSEPGPYPAAEFGDSSDIMVGETVLAMGSPFGLGRTVTTGVVSAVGRDIQVRDRTFSGLIQTDAAVNQGNSGGALLNILGEWIGVNSAIYSLSGGSDGISFAIPIQVVRDFVAREMRPRNVADVWLGWELEEGPTGGVRIATVYPTGPAASRGLRNGTQLVSIEGKPVPDLFSARLAAIDALSRGKSVRLRTKSSTGTQEQVLGFEPVPTDELTWARLGVVCAPITPELSQKFAYREGSGVVILRVRPEGAAARIGLREGDLLQALGPQPIRSREDLLVAVQWINRDQTVDVKLRRVAMRGLRRVHETLEGRLQAD